jgi:hypothetical protein
VIKATHPNFEYQPLFPPEELGDAGQERMTASIMYNRVFHDGNWSSTAVWGRTRSLQDYSIFNTYLVESTVRFHTDNNVWTRIENVDRSNELLMGRNPLPPNFREEPIVRVQGYSFGYDHDFDLIPHAASVIGAQFMTYGVPGVLKTAYGLHPVGIGIFLRLRPVGREWR